MKLWEITGGEPRPELPKVWYHGTSQPGMTDFDSKRIGSMMGVKSPGFWFAANREAVGYYGHNMVEARLHFQNPMLVSEEQYEQGKPHGPSSWAKKAKNDGHDAVIIFDIIDGDTYSTIACIFDPKQIEVISATNHPLDETVVENINDPHFKLFTNPSAQSTKNIVSRASHGFVKGLYYRPTRTVYLWDAYYAVHGEISSDVLNMEEDEVTLIAFVLTAREGDVYGFQAMTPGTDRDIREHPSLRRLKLVELNAEDTELWA